MQAKTYPKTILGLYTSSSGKTKRSRVIDENIQNEVISALKEAGVGARLVISASQKKERGERDPDHFLCVMTAEQLAAEKAELAAKNDNQTGL